MTPATQRMRKRPAPKQTSSIVLPKALHQAVWEFARKDNRSFNNVIHTAVIFYLAANGQNVQEETPE